MSYSVETIPHFDKHAKKLSKKYNSLKSDLASLVATLKGNPFYGTNLGNGLYKIRLAITAKGKGKSGGARVITYVKVIQKTIYLVSIYDKGELESIARKEILELLKKTGLI